MYGLPVSAQAERRSLANSSPSSSVFTYHLQFQGGFVNARCTYVYYAWPLGHFEVKITFVLGLLILNMDAWGHIKCFIIAERVLLD